ncbi:MAG TPA: hypothetical protein VM692_10290 [Gammaproteobacteria bacterium]|nr:hypothetical protein [Gammaproteobacteria bacterium]
MQRQIRTALAAALVFGSSGALAQDGTLAGVTMRVLDDLQDVDAVVLELDAGRGETEDGAPSPEPREGAAAEGAGRSRDTAAREVAAEGERRAERRERDALHDVDEDERAEGRLEDRDVERSTQPPPPAAP